MRVPHTSKRRRVTHAALSAKAWELSGVGYPTGELPGPTGE